MTEFRLTGLGALAAMVFAAGGQVASAQQASGQYYGYGSAQAPLPSGQGYACQPNCYVEKIGCNVNYCPWPPPCQNVQINVPGFEIPSCQNPYVIKSELPPSRPPIDLVIYRNHYVPIKVVNVPPPVEVQPVNILVKFREVHYLCDCPPGTSPCPHLPSPQGGMPSLQVGDKEEGAGEPQPQLASTTPQQPAAAPAAPAPAAVQANAPPKRWIWLTNEGAFGYGYQRDDGLWEIDPGSLRATPPDPNTPPASLSVASMTGS